MASSNLEILKNMAFSEPHKQQFLFVFAEAEEMDNTIKTDHKSGTITPVMCVDKAPEDLKSFEDLVKEADSISDKWNFVFIGALSGTPTDPPSDKQIEKYLKKMTDDIVQGVTVGQRVVLDRQERHVVIS